MRTPLRLFSCIVLLAGIGACALAAPANRLAKVTPDGLLRWQDDNSEVALFGVNYIAPFTMEYAALGSLGLDRRKVIEQDVLHFQRLGLTCMRMPVWDREISDREGNLLQNEPLALQDHLIAEGKRRGIYMILTAMVWYATGNPSPGFSTYYTMEQTTTDPGAPRAAQARYLAQFAQHRNPETGLTYAEDPAVLGFELINEPVYPATSTDAQITEYINAMAMAIRDTGCRKPIFSSGWNGRLAAIGASAVDGVTFSTYPTGLASGGMLTGNYLPTVDDFPSMRDPALRAKAKGLYEFDAADVGWSYMYPAMARSFRSGGAQFANQFQYDDWATAASNCCCQTHYLSLPYTPGKAISLMIAGEAFRRIPRLARFGHTPAADRFGPFRVSYEQRLSEMVTDTEFLYSNDTATRPKSPEHLTRIAGVGASSVVSYDGTGAYFLDRLAPGTWRLEVYPDVVWVADPFARRTVDDETARIVWARRTISLRLPDLGDAFTVTPVNDGNAFRPAVRQGAFAVLPGVYRLSRRGAQPETPVNAEFFAPPPATGRAIALWHKPQDVAVEGQSLPIEATCTADGARLTLCYRNGDKWVKLPMQQTKAYAYAGSLPPAALRSGVLQYAILAEAAGKVTAFPDGRPAGPDIAAPDKPFVILAASQLHGAPEATVFNAPETTAKAVLSPTVLQLSSTPLDPQRDCGVDVRIPVARPASVDDRAVVRIRARALQPGTTGAQFTLIQDDGRTYATTAPLCSVAYDLDVPIREWWPAWQTANGRLDLTHVRELSVAYGRWLFQGGAAQPHGVEIESLSIVPPPSTWRVPVHPVGPPIQLLLPRPVAAHQSWQSGLRLMVVPGPKGEDALEIAHPGFGPPPDCSVISGGLPPQPPARRAILGQCDTLRLTVRSRTSAANSLQVALTEADGAPWGADIPLTADWQTIDLPLANLKFFGHWTHPDGRGGKDDRCHPERLERWTVAFGAWQTPERAKEPHIIQIASIELVRSKPVGGHD